jgi:hypothetical protein
MSQASRAHVACAAPRAITYNYAGLENPVGPLHEAPHNAAAQAVTDGVA